MAKEQGSQQTCFRVRAQIIGLCVSHFPGGVTDICDWVTTRVPQIPNMTLCETKNEQNDTLSETKFVQIHTVSGDHYGQM